MKKKLIISTVAVLLTLSLVGVIVNASGGSQRMNEIKYVTLNKGDLTNTVSSRGVVESSNSKNIYSTSGLIISSVNVKVGDIVQEGQVLAQVDTQDLMLNIEQQKAELNKTQQNNLAQLQNNQRIYDESNTNLKNGNNSQLLNAEVSLKTAKINLETAERNYNSKLEEYTNNSNSQILNAESALVSAAIDLESKKTTYENNKILYESGIITREEFNKSEDSYIMAQNQHNDAVISLENFKKSLNLELEQLLRNLETAKVNYDNAAESQKAVIASVQQELSNQKSNLQISEIATNNDSQIIAIQKLEKQLEDSIIKTPMTGTVTAVYATEGSAATGLLFIVEDLNDLKINAKIKEYDLGKIEVGMQVNIKSDSTGDKIYKGELTKISPTSIKDSTSSDVEFEAQVTILSIDTELKVGMNTRLDIILESKENIYSVPYDAIITNSSGNKKVYIIKENGNGKGIATEVIVETGLEADFYVEIMSDELIDGIKIISDASKITPGEQVSIDINRDRR